MSDKDMRYCVYAKKKMPRDEFYSGLDARRKASEDAKKKSEKPKEDKKPDVKSDSKGKDKK